MKRLIAVVLAVVLIAGGLGGVVYAQVNGHEPITGHKLYGMGAMGTLPSGTQADFAVAFTNPDCVSDITIERVSIIRDDGEVMFEGKLSELPYFQVDVVEPHQVVGFFVAHCIPDGSGGWLSYEEALALPFCSYIVEIFYNVSQSGGLLLIGERHTALIPPGAMEPSSINSLPMVNIEQVLEPEKVEKPPKPKDKDSIVIGASRPLTGPNAPIHEAALGPIMEMWQEEVNADGGIYVAEYGRKLPVEFIIYDDATDIGTMMALTEKLIVEDQVDILFSACGTAFIEAQAAIANEYGMVLITAEGGSTDIRDMLPELPYVFATLPFSDHYQLPVLADMLAAEGAETAYMITIADSHGVEYGSVAAIEFDRVGIEVLANVSVPITYTDFHLLVQDAKAANPDVFCVFAYPPIILPVTGEMMGQGFNPPAVIMGPGGNFGFYGATFGVETVEGVTCFAAANSNTSPEFAEFFADLEAHVGFVNVDWWGAPYYRSLLQIWQQAIEATGTLDQDVIRDYIAATHFDTILGDTWFTMFGEGGGLLAKESHPGEIGQWQGGTVEIVGGGDWPNTVLTADFIYPKPDWLVTQPQYNQAHAYFTTNWDYWVEGDSFTNDEVTGAKSWNAGSNNSADATGSPLTGLTLRLYSGLAFDNVWCPLGTLVTEGPPVYEWSFSDVVQDTPAHAQPGASVGFWGDPHPFPVTFTPGFDASRIADKTVFLQSEGTQTQTLTISVTPREQPEVGNWGLHVSLPTWLGLVDAIIQPPTGVDFALSPDGQFLWMWPSGLTVDDKWTVTVTIEITPEVPQVEYMPHVFIGLYVERASGDVEGNSVSRQAGDHADVVGAWTWNATGEGDLGWHWTENIGRSVHFPSYCWEYQE